VLAVAAAGLSFKDLIARDRRELVCILPERYWSRAVHSTQTAAKERWPAQPGDTKALTRMELGSNIASCRELRSIRYEEARDNAIALEDVISSSTPTKPAPNYDKCGHYSTHQARDSSFGSKPFFEPLLVSPAQNLFGNCLLSVSYFRSSQLDQFLVVVLLKIAQDRCSVRLSRLRRAHSEPLDHFPDRGDLRRILRQVIVASVSPPVPAPLWIEYARGNLRE
jgi:hypothetical protein